MSSQPLNILQPISITLNVITVIIATAAEVIPVGAIISPRLSLIIIINWGGEEAERKRRSRNHASTDQQLQEKMSGYKGEVREQQ